MLITYAVIVVYPMFWLLYTSLKPDLEIFLRPFSLPDPRHLQWNNFSRAWVDGHFGEYFFNSVLLTSTTVLVTVFVSAMTAYALARFLFPGVRAIYFYFLPPGAALGCRVMMLDDDVRESRRSRCATSKPSSFGIMTSRRTRSGRS